MCRIPSIQTNNSKDVFLRYKVPVPWLQEPIFSPEHYPPNTERHHYRNLPYFQDKFLYAIYKMPDWINESRASDRIFDLIRDTRQFIALGAQFLASKGKCDPQKKPTASQRQSQSSTGMQHSRRKSEMPAIDISFRTECSRQTLTLAKHTARVYEGPTVRFHQKR